MTCDAINRCVFCCRSDLIYRLKSYVSMFQVLTRPGYANIYAHSNMVRQTLIDKLNQLEGYRGCID